MKWIARNTKYGSQMPISELLQVVAEIEGVSGVSIYDILMYFKEGYTLQEQTGSYIYILRR